MQPLFVSVRAYAPPCHTLLTGLFVVIVLSFSSPVLHAQKKGSSNTSISLGTSINNLDLYVAPPIGIIGELGLREWGTLGVYGGLTQIRNNFNNIWTTGARFSLQLRGIAEAILRKPLNTYGFKPYIGAAAGWQGIKCRRRDRFTHNFSYSPVIGVRYYPIDRWGLLVEWGETFNGQTGLNVGVSYGGRK